MSDAPDPTPTPAPEQPAADALGPRDYLAGQVIAVALGKVHVAHDGKTIVDTLDMADRAKHIAASSAFAYQVADAMMLARQQGGAA